MPKLRSPIYLIFLTVFIDLIGFGIVIPVLPLYAKNFGASEMTNGWLVGIYSAMQFIAAPLLGKLSDRVGRRPDHPEAAPGRSGAAPMMRVES